MDKEIVDMIKAEAEAFIKSISPPLDCILRDEDYSIVRQAIKSTYIAGRSKSIEIEKQKDERIKELEDENANLKVINGGRKSQINRRDKEIEQLEKRVIELQQADMTHEYNNAEAERVWPQIKEQIEEPFKTFISKTIIHLERVERFDLVEAAKQLLNK